jgi:hypothetical protein
LIPPDCTPEDSRNATPSKPGQIKLYNDLGGDYLRKRDAERTAKRLIAQFEALGHTVTLQEAVAA